MWIAITSVAVYLLLLFSSALGKNDNYDAEILSRLESLEKTVADQAETIKLQSIEITAMKETKTAEEIATYKGNEKSRRFVLGEGGPVAFTAAVAPVSVSHIKHMDTITFETVITSIGGGYNNQTGVFVVPVSGIYAFSCSLLDKGGDNGTYHGTKLHAEIVHGNRVLGRIFAHAETRTDVSYKDQGAQTVYTQASQGDQVLVRAIDNDDLGLGGQLYSTFSGCLVQEM